MTKQKFVLNESNTHKGGKGGRVDKIKADRLCAAGNSIIKESMVARGWNKRTGWYGYHRMNAAVKASSAPKPPKEKRMKKMRMENAITRIQQSDIPTTGLIMRRGEARSIANEEKHVMKANKVAIKEARLQYVESVIDSSSRVDKTVDIRCPIKLCRLLPVIDVLVGECVRLSQPGKFGSFGQIYYNIVATFLDDARNACLNRKSEFIYVPRLWGMITNALRPKMAAGYNYQCVMANEGQAETDFSLYFTPSGMSEQVFATNLAVGDVDLLSGGSAVDVAVQNMVAEGFSMVPDYQAVSDFMNMYPVVLDLVPYSELVADESDCSIFAYRDYACTPIDSEANNYDYLRTIFNYSEYCPGWHPYSISVVQPGTLHYCLVKNSGPFLEVPIKNRWLACLGLFFPPTADEKRNLGCTTRYPHYSSNIASNANPKLEFFHQYYCNREIRQLSSVHNKLAPEKADSYRKEINLIKFNRKSAPTHVPVLLSELIGTSNSAWASNLSSAITISEPWLAAVTMFEVMRHFETWASGTTLYEWFKLETSNSAPEAVTKSFAMPYTGGTYRCSRYGARYKIPTAIAANLSMFYPSLMPTSTGTRGSSKYGYPMLVVDCVPSDFTAAIAQFTVAATSGNKPWVKVTNCEAWHTFIMSNTSCDKLYHTAKDTFSVEIMEIVRHKINLLNCAQVSLQFGPYMNTLYKARMAMKQLNALEGVNCDVKAYAAALENYNHCKREVEDTQALIFKAQHLVKCTTDKIHANDPAFKKLDVEKLHTVGAMTSQYIENMLAFSETFDKATYDAAIELIVPAISAVWDDKTAIQALFGFVYSVSSFGQAQQFDKKAENFEECALQPGGVYTSFNNYIKMYLDAVRKSDKLGWVVDGAVKGITLVGGAMKLYRDASRYYGSGRRGEL